MPVDRAKGLINAIKTARVAADLLGSRTSNAKGDGPLMRNFTASSGLMSLT